MNENSLIKRENELAKITLDLCFRIHKLYGPGLFETVYEEIFCYELSKEKIFFEKQKAIPLVHQEIKLNVVYLKEGIKRMINTY